MEPLSPRAICFDFDGTLVEYTGDFDLLLDGLRADLGLLACDFTTFRARTVAALREQGPLTLASALRSVLEGFGLRDEGVVDGVAASAAREYGRKVEPRSGAADLLARLSGAGVPVALLSNGPEDMQREALNASGLARHFRAVLISGDRDVAVRKPHPRIFDLACTGLETPPQEVLMVGDDRKADVSGALEYGMQAVLLSGDRDPPEGARSIADLHELDRLLYRESDDA